MQNLFLITTDRPISKLQKTKHGNLFLSNEIKSYSDCTNQNIYITSDKEIKESNWCLQVETNEIFKIKEILEKQQVYLDTDGKTHYDNFDPWNVKKIIMTTNSDLIADGVQSIENKFIEWYINNSDCKQIEVVYLGKLNKVDSYELILPKQSNKWKLSNIETAKFIDILKMGHVYYTTEKDMTVYYPTFVVINQGDEWFMQAIISDQEISRIDKELHLVEKNEEFQQESIEKDSVWKHNNGNIYTVIEITNLDSKDLIKYPITVVYKGENGKIWTRPLTDWHRSFTKVKSLKESLRNEIPDNMMSRAAVKYANDNNISSEDFCRETLIFAFYAGTECWQKQYDTSKVTRVEVIQHSPPHNGRVYVNHNAKNVEISLQDDGRTLKLYL